MNTNLETEIQELTIQLRDKLSAAGYTSMICFGKYNQDKVVEGNSVGAGKTRIILDLLANEFANIYQRSFDWSDINKEKESYRRSAYLDHVRKSVEFYIEILLKKKAHIPYTSEDMT